MKREAIAQLKNVDMMRQITQLCDSTGWVYANIGPKYLRVMRRVLALSIDDQFEKKENLHLYEIVSKAVRKIIVVLARKL